jgi:hypothetical protein
MKRTIAILVVVIGGLAVVGCGGPASPSPSSGGSPSASAAPGSPSAAPSSGGSVCAIEPSDGALASDRLEAVRLLPASDADQVLFVFGSPSSPAGAGSGTGLLEAAEPPFVQDGSGLPLDVLGERVVRVRFDGLLLYDEAGVPTNPTESPILGSGTIRSVVREGAFEGVESWLIGFDGPGCVSLGATDVGLTIVVTVQAG